MKVCGYLHRQWTSFKKKAGPLPGDQPFVLLVWPANQLEGVLNWRTLSSDLAKWLSRL